jgi:HEAT repeat protein
VSAPAGFINELEEVGLAVESPWDLVNSRRSYRAAIPVLLEWLERADIEMPPAERPKFREALVRSLAVKEARGVAAPALLREFGRSDASFDYRWAVGSALEVVADDVVFDDVVELARDRSYGRDRQMVVLALARMKDPRSVEVLTELLEDDTVTGHAVMALGRLKAAQARSAIERCLEHPQPWVRKEAKKALAKLGA